MKARQQIKKRDVRELASMIDCAFDESFDKEIRRAAGWIALSEQHVPRIPQKEIARRISIIAAATKRIRKVIPVEAKGRTKDIADFVRFELWGDEAADRRLVSEALHSVDQLNRVAVARLAKLRTHKGGAPRSELRALGLRELTTLYAARRGPDASTKVAFVSAVLSLCRASRSQRSIEKALRDAAGLEAS